jgi:hypothetical protein
LVLSCCGLLCLLFASSRGNLRAALQVSPDTSGSEGEEEEGQKERRLGKKKERESLRSQAAAEAWGPVLGSKSKQHS